MTLAEELAERQNLPVVLLVPLEAGRIMAGNPLIARFADGSEVLVRLYTADEFLAAQHAVAAKYGADPIGRTLAEQIVRPIGDSL